MNYLRQYWPYLRPHRGVLALGILAGLIAGVSSGFSIPFFLQGVFTRIFQEREVGHGLGIIILTAIQLPAVFLIRGVAGYANQYLMVRCGMHILRSVRQAVFDKLQRLPLAWFERQRTGDLISRLITDTLTVQQAILLFARDCIQQPATIIAGVGYLVYRAAQEQNVIFLLLMFALVPLVILPVRIIGKQLKYRGRQVQEALGETTNALQENLRGTIEVRAFNLQESQQASFRERLDSHFRSFMKMTKYDKLMQPIMEVESSVVIAVAFVYAYYAGIALETFLTITVALYFTADASKRFIRMLNDVQKAEGAADRVSAVLAEDSSVADGDNLAKDVLPAPVAGRVRFDNVVFAYETTPVLNELTVDIAPGTFCALVGPSGSGKSTFIKLLARFYDPQSGTIQIDDTPLHTVNARSVRERIALVPQAPVLFNATVGDNIRLANPQATDEEVEQAARAAYAHDFISTLPHGYNTLVGENAVRLSGGQRQRLALARAFLKNAPILILDEATSALDSESEKRIQEALERNAVDRTVFVIAHRFSTIQKADRILVFENGRITGDGNLETLLDHPTFGQLYRNQALGA